MKMGEKKGFFKRLVEGLTKTRNNIVSGIDSIFSGFSAIDDDFYEEIEEILIMGDLGINATTAIIEDLKQKVKEQHIKEPAACKELLIDSIKAQMNVGETAYEFENRQSVVLVIGVNGVGKTTSHRKTGRKIKRPGKESNSGGSRYVPCGSRRTADRMGTPCRCGDHCPDRKDRIRQPLYTMRSQAAKAQSCRCIALRYGRTTS